MNYVRMPIEIESPEQLGYGQIRYNLTESSFRDADLGATLASASDEASLSTLLLCYGDHLGLLPLRQHIATQASQPGLPPIHPDEVLCTAGAATALFIVATTLLAPGDELIVVRPNYATNIETPRAIGAQITFLDLRFEEGWRLDVARLAAAITPRTKLISITTPHNPTGMQLSPETLHQIVGLVQNSNARLLVDETYREQAFSSPLPTAAQLSPSAISVSSLSKTYGLPGLRIGWLICRDPVLRERFLAAKEQIMICNSILDETVAERFLRTRAARLPQIHAQTRAHFAIVKDWIISPPTCDFLEWVEPQGGVVAFPRIRAAHDGRLLVDPERFYEILNRMHSTYVGPGHWFEQPRRCFRLGYGWPTTDELRGGLACITDALQRSQT